jgi:o-succinylbenzoate---CoA ligase
MEPWIRFERNQIRLIDVSLEISNPSYSQFEKSVLAFCHEWLQGKDSFTLSTSGSTGTPKQITITRNQLKASALLTANKIGLHQNDTSLICLDVRYIAGIMMMVRSLEVGMNMVVVAPSSNPLEKVSPSDKIDFTAMVPLQVETILKSPQRDRLNEIGIVLIGGAALNAKTIKKIEVMKCCFYATYGMTETISHIALQKLNGESAQHYFETLAGITLSKDERDCLVIYAPHVSDKPIITNDLIEFVTPSKFHWLGRFDSIINTGGIKVIPEKVESSIDSILSTMDFNRRFFIASLPDELYGKSVNLFIEGSPLSPESEEMLQQTLKSTLSRFERPKSIRYIETFAETETGKINKIKTVELF